VVRSKCPTGSDRRFSVNCRHCGGEITVHDADIGKVDECRDCAKDVEKYVGHMIWDHKTAPALEVHANMKSLMALRDGRYNTGQLVYEVKERSRRRESDLSGSEISLSPYVRKEDIRIDSQSEELPKIELRRGSGKTVATFGRTVLDKSRAGGKDALSHLQGEKLLLAKAAAKILPEKIAGISITVFKDDRGFYVIPRKSETASRLDHETSRALGFRTANYSRF
jgi:hypothetical protein